MQRRNPNKIGGWELLLLLMAMAILSLSFGYDDPPQPQPVNGYTYQHKLSDAEFLDGAPVNAAPTQEAGR